MNMRPVWTQEDKQPKRPQARSKLLYDLPVRTETRLEDETAPRAQILNRLQHRLGTASKEGKGIRGLIICARTDDIQAVFPGCLLCE